MPPRSGRSASPRSPAARRTTRGPWRAATAPPRTARPGSPRPRRTAGRRRLRSPLDDLVVQAQAGVDGSHADREHREDRAQHVGRDADLLRQRLERRARAALERAALHRAGERERGERVQDRCVARAATLPHSSARPLGSRSRTTLAEFAADVWPKKASRTTPKMSASTSVSTGRPSRSGTFTCSKFPLSQVAEREARQRDDRTMLTAPMTSADAIVASICFAPQQPQVADEQQRWPRARRAPGGRLQDGAEADQRDERGRRR